MNRKGFTLVELLASMVILGILMAITIPNIMGILGQNKNNVYIEDAQKLVSAAKYKYSAFEKKLDNNQCAKMTLAYLNNGEFNDPPNGGDYFNDGSYVIINKSGGITSYYVSLAETTDKKVYYIPYTKYESLAKNDGSIVQEGTSFPHDTHGSGCEQYDASKADMPND